MLSEVNDLPLCVRSHVGLFADDCLLYRSVKTQQDQQQLQADLHSLEKWTTKWGMRFNATKCYIMSISLCGQCPFVGVGPTLYLNSRTASALRRYRLFLWIFGCNVWGATKWKEKRTKACPSFQNSQWPGGHTRWK
jgi:hypothetical protein